MAAATELQQQVEEAEAQQAEEAEEEEVTADQPPEAFAEEWESPEEPVDNDVFFWRTEDYFGNVQQLVSDYQIKKLEKPQFLVWSKEWLMFKETTEHMRNWRKTMQNKPDPDYEDHLNKLTARIKTFTDDAQMQMIHAARGIGGGPAVSLEAIGPVREKETIIAPAAGHTIVERVGAEYPRLLQIHYTDKERPLVFEHVFADRNAYDASRAMWFKDIYEEHNIPANSLVTTIVAH